LLQHRDKIQRVGLVLITGDKGLCGSYNHNMIQKAWHFISESPYPVELITVGKRGRDAMWRFRQKIVAEFSNLPPQPGVLDVAPIARTAVQGFISGQFDVVYLAHTALSIPWSSGRRSGSSCRSSRCNWKDAARQAPGGRTQPGRRRVYL